MNVYDMHIHIFPPSKKENKPDPAGLIAKMETAGVYGGCLFSNRPEPSKFNGMCFEARMEELLKWTEGYPDRLFPVLWIHPDEKNVLENMEIAAKQGVVGFKIICNNFYVYEEKCMQLLRKSAEMNKPVFFHSGILWDNQIASVYNRPINWEHLLQIRGLRFSMAHCSWPWIDECLALYGEFQNSPVHKDGAEIFLDITPGTPKLYRKELLTKLYKIGYDTAGNLLYGTDAVAENYDSGFVRAWKTLDGEILDELEIGQSERKMLYQDNLMRFLGIDGK